MHIISNHPSHEQIINLGENGLVGTICSVESIGSAEVVTLVLVSNVVIQDVETERNPDVDTLYIE